jgi:hypothetical protein
MQRLVRVLALPVKILADFSRGSWTHLQIGNIMNTKEFWEEVHAGNVNVGDKVRTVHVSGLEEEFTVTGIKNEKKYFPSEGVQDHFLVVLCTDKQGDRAIYQSVPDFSEQMFLTKASEV